MTGADERNARYAALMQSVQAGDRAAYAELLHDITPLLRRIVRQRQPFALQHHQVEDLVQDILLSLHAARATYDPRRPFVPWLGAIVRNRMADDARRAIRQQRTEAAARDWSETFLPDPANTVAETYGDPDALHEAIASLPGGQRRAVELLKLRELSLREASAVSGMSVGALKVAVHRGIRTLRMRLMREV